MILFQSDIMKHHALEWQKTKEKIKIINSNKKLLIFQI